LHQALDTRNQGLTTIQHRGPEIQLLLRHFLLLSGMRQKVVSFALLFIDNRSLMRMLFEGLRVLPRPYHAGENDNADEKSYDGERNV